MFRVDQQLKRNSMALRSQELEKAEYCKTWQKKYFRSILFAETFPTINVSFTIYN